MFGTARRIAGIDERALDPDGFAPAMQVTSERTRFELVQDGRLVKHVLAWMHSEGLVTEMTRGGDKAHVLAGRLGLF